MIGVGKTNVLCKLIDCIMQIMWFVHSAETLNIAYKMSGVTPEYKTCSALVFLILIR